VQHPLDPVPKLDYNRDTAARLEWVHKLQVQGKEDWAIAAILGVSDSTVKRDLVRIKKRINFEHELIRHRNQLEWTVRESIGRYSQALEENDEDRAMAWFDRILKATSGKTKFINGNNNQITFVQQNIQNNVNGSSDILKEIREAVYEGEKSTKVVGAKASRD